MTTEVRKNGEKGVVLAPVMLLCRRGLGEIAYAHWANSSSLVNDSLPGEAHDENNRTSHVHCFNDLYDHRHRGKGLLLDA